MGSVSTKVWASLDKWSAPVFLIAGVLLLVTAVGLGIELVTDMSLQGPIVGIPQFLGLILAYVGLLGLYPQLKNHSPQLALAGIVLILIPVVTLILFLLYELAVGGEPSYVDMIFMVIGVGFALGIGLFGIASFRTEVPSRSVGLFLLVFAIPWLMLIGMGAENSVLVDFIISVLNAVSVLAIGYLLRTQSVPADRGQPAADAAP